MFKLFLSYYIINKSFDKRKKYNKFPINYNQKQIYILSSK